MNIDDPSFVWPENYMDALAVLEQEYKTVKMEISTYQQEDGGLDLLFSVGKEVADIVLEAAKEVACEGLGVESMEALIMVKLLDGEFLELYESWHQTPCEKHPNDD